MIRKLVTIATAVTVMVGGLLAPTAANAVAPFSPSVTVPANTASVPSFCKTIAKATAPNFKVTAKQKGKYITVGITNKNLVGVTTVLAPSLAKSK